MLCLAVSVTARGDLGRTAEPNPNYTHYTEVLECFSKIQIRPARFKHNCKKTPTFHAPFK